MEAQKRYERDFPIVFYDGDCGFCNKSVQFILNQERSAVIRFAALQSEFAVSFFREHRFPPPDMSTFCFFEHKKLYVKSRAAFRVIRYLAWYWQPLRVFRLLPVSFTDGIYDFIAARRKRIAGEFCALPTAKQRARFLN